MEIYSAFIAFLSNETPLLLTNSNLKKEIPEFQYIAGRENLAEVFDKNSDIFLKIDATIINQIVALAAFRNSEDANMALTVLRRVAGPISKTAQ